MFQYYISRSQVLNCNHMPPVFILVHLAQHKHSNNQQPQLHKRLKICTYDVAERAR